MSQKTNAGPTSPENDPHRQVSEKVITRVPEFKSLMPFGQHLNPHVADALTIDAVEIEQVRDDSGGME